MRKEYANLPTFGWLLEVGFNVNLLELEALSRG